MRQFHRRFEINEDFFEKINNREKAYILGLLYADGCNTRRGLSISLSGENDAKLLQKIKKLLFKNAPELSRLKLNAKNSNHQDSFTLTACSQKFSDDLLKLGCMPAKSLILKFPDKKQVPTRFIKDFIRGYFDGDGSIILSKKNKRATISITGTENFLINLAHYLKENGIVSSIYATTSKAKNIKSLRFSSKKNIDIFYNLIYTGNSLFLRRKRKKFVLYFSKRNNVPKLSKYLGVTYDKTRKKWKAALTRDSKTINLGRFENENEAYKKVLEYIKNEC